MENFLAFSAQFLVSLLSEKSSEVTGKITAAGTEKESCKVDDLLFQMNIPWTETQGTD